MDGVHCWKSGADGRTALILTPDHNAQLHWEVLIRLPVSCHTHIYGPVNSHV